MVTDIVPSSPDTHGCPVVKTGATVPSKGIEVSPDVSLVDAAPISPKVGKRRTLDLRADLTAFSVTSVLTVCTEVCLRGFFSSFPTYTDHYAMAAVRLREARPRHDATIQPSRTRAGIGTTRSDTVATTP